MNNQKLKPCPFCGGEATIYEFKRAKTKFTGCMTDRCIEIPLPSQYAIHCNSKDGCNGGRPSTKLCDSLNEAIEKWNKRAEPPADQWIPCSERLPKQYERVLVTATVMQTVFLKESKVAVDVGYLITEGVNEFILSAAGTRQYAKAWMPLPEPYKGVE